ncbi:MAG: thrombospondin type 3 repeat-containing protein [Halobacteriales archaeon]|nr:thrombospondin type 3 repeat-containing protein [Halobacteriales archaeon]
MMRKAFTTVVLGALTLFGADMAIGQTMHRSFELTGMAGVRVYDDDVVFMDSGWVAGGKLAWFPHANIGVEATASFSKASFVDASEGDDVFDEIDDIFGGDDVDVTEIRIDAVYQFLYEQDQMLVPYFSAGVGQLVFDAAQEDELGTEVTDEPATSINWGGGVKVFFNDRFALRLDARDNVALVDRFFETAIPAPNTKTFQANNPEFQVGITIGLGGSEEGFGVRDTDMDGVPDKDDLCPNTPRGVIVDETGCPVDSDGDGVPDGLDACPNTPEGAMVDERGCPLDSDNDGVFDGIDQCPNTPAGVQVDETGCPIEVEEEEACLDDQAWYTGDATINVDGKNWVKFGATKTVAMDDITQIGEYRGVPVYVGSDATRPYEEILLPLCGVEDTYQPYRLESEIRGTTGFIRGGI